MTERTDSGHPLFGGRVVRGLGRGAAVAAIVTALVAGSAGAPPRGAEAPASAAVTGRASAAPHGTYELTRSSAPSQPLRWPACRPIDYRINRASMPTGMDAVVKASMAVIAKQTGARFHYAGTTKRTFSTTSRPSTPTIYIGFTPKRKAYGRTFSYPGEIGVGGPSGAWYQDGDGRRYEAITSGRVLLSTTFTGPRRGAGATWQSLIVHEVGHALNLAHRSPIGDAMHASLSEASPGRFRPAEVRALKKVLQTSGCDYRAWSRL